jgi:hypothetical protein
MAGKFRVQNHFWSMPHAISFAVLSGKTMARKFNQDTKRATMEIQRCIEIVNTLRTVQYINFCFYVRIRRFLQTA